MHDAGLGISFEDLGLGEGDGEKIFSAFFVVVETIVRASGLNDLPPAENGKATEGSGNEEQDSGGYGIHRTSLKVDSSCEVALLAKGPCRFNLNFTAG